MENQPQPTENMPKPEGEQIEMPPSAPEQPQSNPLIPVDPDAKGPVETAGSDTEIDGGL
jgi:hypothetical protein